VVALGWPLRDAVRAASLVAARSVERRGTQSSYPERAEVARALGSLLEPM
jgi:sugar/nucleoside kinase (ribokinase family)